MRYVPAGSEHFTCPTSVSPHLSRALGITRLNQVLQVNRPVTCPSLSKSYLHSVLFTSDLTDYFPFSETAHFSVMIITYFSF